jgi:hypothetical protein
VATLKALSGKLVDPGGNLRAGRGVRAVLSQPCVIPSTQEIAPRSVGTTSADDGTWAVQLYSNADLSPAGTYYTVYEEGDAPRTVVIPQTAGPFKISDPGIMVPPLAPPPVDGHVSTLLVDGDATVGGAGNIFLLDAGGYVYNIANAKYGAVPKSSPTDTQNDITPIIVQACADASAAGGGVVYVPPSIFGWFCPGITAGTITIPSNVTLLGATRPGVGTYERVSSLSDPHIFRGSELHVTANRNDSAAGHSFLTLDRNARVEGISFFYPDQDPTLVTPYAYPPTVTLAPDGSGKLGGAVVDACMFVNSWIAIRAVAHDAPLIRNIRGQPLNTGILVDQCHNTPRVQDVLFWQFWHELNAFANLDTYIQNNAIAFQFLDVDGIQFEDLACFGYHQGMVLGSPGVGGYGSGTNLDMDACQQCYVVQEAGPEGWLLSNVAAIAGGGAGTASRCLLVTGGTAGASGETDIRGFNFNCGSGTPVEVQSTAHLAVKISQGHIHDWTTAAIKTSSTDADVMATDVTFWHASGPHLDVSAISAAAWNADAHKAFIALLNCSYKNQPRNILAGTDGPPIRGCQAGGVAAVPNSDNKIVITHNMGLVAANFTLCPLTDTLGLTYRMDTFTKTQATIRMSGIPASAVTFLWTISLSND